MDVEWSHAVTTSLLAILASEGDSEAKLDEEFSHLPVRGSMRVIHSDKLLHDFEVATFPDFVRAYALINVPGFALSHKRLTFQIMDTAGSDAITIDGWLRWVTLTPLADPYSARRTFDLLTTRETQAKGVVAPTVGATMDWRVFERYCSTLVKAYEPSKRWESLRDARRLGDSETVVKSSWVTDHTELQIGVSGWLFLTTRALYFDPVLKATFVAKTGGQRVLPLSSMARVDPTRAGVFAVDAALEIVMESGIETVEEGVLASNFEEGNERFVFQFASGRDSWVRYIAELILAFRKCKELKVGSAGRRNSLSSPSVTQIEPPIEPTPTPASQRSLLSPGVSPFALAGVGLASGLMGFRHESPAEAEASPKKQKRKSVLEGMTAKFDEFKKEIGNVTRKKGHESLSPRRHHDETGSDLSSPLLKPQTPPEPEPDVALTLKPKRHLRSRSVGGDPITLAEAVKSQWSSGLPTSPPLESPLLQGSFPDGNDVPLLVQLSGESIIRARAMHRARGCDGTSLLLFTNKLMSNSEIRRLVAGNKLGASLAVRVRTFMSVFTTEDDAATHLGKVGQEAFQAKRLLGNVDVLIALLEPMGPLVKSFLGIFTWDNPPASVLGCIVVWVIFRLNLSVRDVLAILIFLQVFLVGFWPLRRMIRGRNWKPPASTKERDPILATLRKVQNQIGDVNETILKLKGLYLGSSIELTRRYVVVVIVAAVVVYFVPLRWIWLALMIHLFTINNLFNMFPRFKIQHDAVYRFWSGVPPAPNPKMVQRKDLPDNVLG